MGRVPGLLVSVVLLATGCGGSERSAPTSAAADRAVAAVGADLFEERVIGGAPGCVTCHSMDDGVILVGPSLFGLAERAASRVPDVTAEDYVRQSIIEPDAFVVPGFASGQMVGDWAEKLSDQQIESLVVLLLGN